MGPSRWALVHLSSAYHIPIKDSIVTSFRFSVDGNILWFFATLRNCVFAKYYGLPMSDTGAIACASAASAANAATGIIQCCH